MSGVGGKGFMIHACWQGFLRPQGGFHRPQGIYYPTQPILPRRYNDLVIKGKISNSLHNKAVLIKVNCIVFVPASRNPVIL